MFKLGHGFAGLEIEEALTFRDDDLDAVNSRDEPERLRPAALDSVRIEDTALSATLPPASWNLLRLSPVQRSG